MNKMSRHCTERSIHHSQGSTWIFILRRFNQRAAYLFSFYNISCWSIYSVMVCGGGLVEACSVYLGYYAFYLQLLPDIMCVSPILSMQCSRDIPEHVRVGLRWRQTYTVLYMTIKHWVFNLVWISGFILTIGFVFNCMDRMQTPLHSIQCRSSVFVEIELND